MAIVWNQPKTSKKPGDVEDAPGACAPPKARPADPIDATADIPATIAEPPTMPTAAYDAAGVFVVLPFVTDVSTHASSSLPSADLRDSLALPCKLGIAYATAGMTEAYSVGIMYDPTALKLPAGTDTQSALKWRLDVMNTYQGRVAQCR